MKNKFKNISLIATVILLTACGGGSGGSIPSAGSSSNYGNNDSIKEITPIISKLDFGGNSYAIELSNDKKTAYFANGVEGIAIVDVANIKKPKLISELQLGERSARSGDNIVDIKLSKDNKTAYLVGSDDGLYIVDISNINNPTLIGKFKTDGRARRVRLSQNEDIAYVAIGDSDESKSGLSIIDISNHSNPTRIGKYHAEDSVNGIAISKDDKKAFLTDLSEGLKIVDISTRTKPVLITNIKFHNRKIESIELSKDEKSLYIMGGSLIVVDISTIDNPKVIKRVLTPSHTHNITVTKNMLYLAPSVGIQFVNIDDPKKAFREGSFSTPFYTQDISVSDDEKVAYLANGLDGLVIMDISKHKSPALISGGLRENSVLGFDLALSNDEKVSYQAQGGEGIRIVDVSNPKSPKLLTVFEGDEDESFYAEYIALSNDNHYAYVVDSSNYKLQVVDITNPTNPVLVGSYNYKDSKFLDNYGNTCTGIAISKDNKKAYLSIWEHGFIVVDIQDPTNPHEIAGLELRGEYSEALVEGIAVNKDNKNLFLSTSNGVLIFDISDLGNISIVSRTFHDNPVNVILSNDEKKMYVLDSGTMYIEDITDIQHPKRLSSLGDVGNKLVISKDNKRAYSINRYNGLRVIDIGTPTKPKIVGKIVLPGLAIELAVTNNGDIAYIETFESGLTIMSLKDFK